MLPAILLLHCKDTIQKIRTHIPRKGIARPQSQFPRLCVCARFIYPHDWSAYSAAGKYVDLYKSLTENVNVEIGTEA